jgi:hypothetical protein
MMRKLFPLLSVAAMFSVLGLVVVAAEVKTITGAGQCAKCSLKEQEKCQNAVVVEEGGKKVTYYLTGKVSKAFHKNVCTEVKKVKATGDVSEKDGKQMMAVTEINVVE